MRYREPLFRPPAEAESLIFQVALGCPHNACRFCAMYKGVAYRAGKEEKANMKLVSVTKELLHTYFTATQYPLSSVKSMADYVRQYNAVRDLATNGKPVKQQSFPDHPDSDYEKTLGPEKLSAFRMHLVQLGWKKVEGVWSKKDVHAH